MRSLLVALLIFGSLPVVIVKPHVGVLVWSWIGYMNPHRLTWGFAYQFPFAMVVGLTTIGAWALSREPKTVPWHPLVLLLAVFTAWISFTTLLAVYPEPAQAKWDRTIKILLFNGFVTLGLISTRQRLDALIWVIVASLGFYALKGTAFMLLTGGRHRLFGPDESFITDNNALGLALLMTLPLVRYLQLRASRRWLRLGLLLALACFVVAILGTYSRGAAVGLAVAIVGLAIKSRHRMRLALFAGITLAGAVQLMPENWHARITSIAEYEQDESAQARFQSWDYALEVVRDSPIVGGGFAIFQGNEAPTTLGYRSAHSIYFETLAEHGYPGLLIFLALGIGTYLSAGATIRRARDHPDLTWAADLAAMVQVSIAAYAVAGLFLNLATFDLYYHLIAVVVIASSLVRQRLESGVPSPSPSTYPFDPPMLAPDADRRRPDHAGGSSRMRTGQWISRLVIAGGCASGLLVAPVGSGRAIAQGEGERNVPAPITETGPSVPADRTQPPGGSESDQAPRTLRVCPAGDSGTECRYYGLRDALAAALPGDHLVLGPGIYEEGAIVATPGLVLRGEPGAHLRGGAVEGKAALVIKADRVVVEGIECSGVAVRDGNGACIRIEGDDLTVRDVHFHDNQQGILSGPGGGALLVENSLFERNGFGGRAHGLYVGPAVETFVFRNNRVLATTGQGHGVKSRAQRTIIESNVIAGLDGPDSRAIDVPNGGEVMIRGNVLEKGPNSESAQMIGLALESPLHEVNETQIEGNLILFDTRPEGLIQDMARAVGLLPAKGVVVQNASPGQVILRRNTIVGAAALGSSVTDIDNRIYESRSSSGLPAYPVVPDAVR